MRGKEGTGKGGEEREWEGKVGEGSKLTPWVLPPPFCVDHRPWVNEPTSEGWKAELAMLADR